MEIGGARVLVTGVARGIGAALAGALRQEGAEVIGVARTPLAGAETCDVSDARQVEELRARTGPVDCLVNNAGVIHEPAPLTDLPLPEWRRLFDVNVFGLVAMCKAYVPAMNERRRGVVVNVSSTWGRSVAPRQAPYCATKWAVEALSRTLAAEVAPGVAVLAVNPGVVATDMLETCFERDVSGFTPPADCAAAFVRLLRRVGPSWNGRSVDVDEF